MHSFPTALQGLAYTIYTADALLTHRWTPLESYMDVASSSNAKKRKTEGFSIVGLTYVYFKNVSLDSLWWNELF